MTHYTAKLEDEIIKLEDETDRLLSAITTLRKDIEILREANGNFAQLNFELVEALEAARGYLDPSPIIQGKIDALLAKGRE